MSDRQKDQVVDEALGEKSVDRLEFRGESLLRRFLWCSSSFGQ